MLSGSIVLFGMKDKPVAPAAIADNPKLRIETTRGSITVELYPDQALATVENFLKYVDAGLYEQDRLPSGHQKLHDPGRWV